MRVVLFKDHKKATVLPFFLNLLFANGIGSWVQGHTAGGLIGTIGTLGGVGLLLNSGTQEIGWVVLGVTYATGLVLPWNYGSSYNKRLKRALSIDGLSLLYLGPTMDLAANGSVVPGVGIHLGF